MSDVQPAAQPAPRTPEEVAAVEAKWLKEVYKGDSLPELTLQVIVISIFLGFLMISFNIYMGLKTGWGEGGSIIAVILGYAVMKTLGRKYSTLENNATQTFASAAGSLGNIVNVIPALILLAESGVIERGPTFMEVLLWVFFTSFLGVFFAIPLRRQMLVIDQLVFPTGTASAQTIQAMHATGDDAMAKAKMLGGVGLVSALITLGQNFWPHIIDKVVFPFAKIKTFGGIALSELTFATAISPMMFGAGFLVGPRVGTSLLIGGFAAFGIMAPLVIEAGVAEEIARNLLRPENRELCGRMFDGAVPMDPAVFGAQCKSLAQLQAGNYYSLVVKWTMWPGLGIMVAAGLTATFTKWRIMLSAIRSLFQKNAGVSPIAHLEFPTRYWVGGLIFSTIGVCGMLQLTFGVPWYFGLLAVALSFILAVIAVRATGETDINPVGAMGSVTQIAFGTLQSATIGGAGMVSAITTGNLMTGGVAAGGASEAADMMQDLKTGWLVGATPRRQVYAQLMGVTIGSLFCAAIFWVLIQAAPIGSETWPAPAAITWSGLAQMMAQGSSALPAGAITALIVGIIVGVAITLVNENAPASVVRWTPSAVGLGVAMVVPYKYCVSIFLGSMVYLGIKLKNPAWILAFAGAVGAGGIAGEGLAGVFAATVQAAPTIWAMISGG